MTYCCFLLLVHVREKVVYGGGIVEFENLVGRRCLQVAIG